jgi:hypothetical protein
MPKWNMRMAKKRDRFRQEHHKDLEHFAVVVDLCLAIFMNVRCRFTPPEV